MDNKWLKRTNMFWLAIWVLIFAAVAGLLMWVLFSGKRVDSGSDIGTVEVKSINCESDSVAYPMFEYDNSDRKNLKIVATYEENEVKSVSLQYILYYSDKDLIAESDGKNHAAMNVAFGKDGMEADSLGAIYAKFDDRLKFNIYVTGDDLNGAAKKYFMLGDAADYKIDTVRQEYGKIGLNCIDN